MVMAATKWRTLVAVLFSRILCARRQASSSLGVVFILRTSGRRHKQEQTSPVAASGRLVASLSAFL